MLTWVILGLIGAGALWFAGKVSLEAGLLPSVRRILFALCLVGAVFVYLCETQTACASVGRLILSLLAAALILLLWMVDDWRVSWWKVLMIIPVLFGIYVIVPGIISPSRTWQWITHGFSWQRVVDEENEEIRQEGLQYDAELRKAHGIPEKVVPGTEHVTIAAGTALRPLDATISDTGLFNPYESDSPPELTKVFVIGDKVVFVKAYKIARGRILVYDISSQRIILDSNPSVVDCITDSWITNDVLSVICGFNFGDDDRYKPRYGEILNINLTTGNFEIVSAQSSSGEVAAPTFEQKAAPKIVTKVQSAPNTTTVSEVDAFIAVRDRQRKVDALALALAASQFNTDYGGNWDCASGMVPKVATAIKSGPGGFDAEPCLAPEYIARIMYDPSVGYWRDETDYDSGYFIYQDTQGKFVVTAPSAENGEIVARSY